MSRPHINRAERHEVAFTGCLEPLETDGENASAIDVKLIDLSTGGVGIACNTPLEPDSKWTLRIDPELCGDFDETVVVRSCREEEGQYRCGLQFVTAATLFVKAGLGIHSAVQNLNTTTSDTAQQPSYDSASNKPAQITFNNAVVIGQLAEMQVTADKDLTVNGSMQNCMAILGGPLRVDETIAGGHIQTSDTIHVKTLGDPNHPTTLVLGSLPSTNALIARVPKQLEAFDQQIKDSKDELAYFKNHGSEVGHNARERAMEVEFGLQGLEEKRALLQQKFEELLEHYRENISVGLHIEKAIHPGVVIEFANQQYRIAAEISGPLTIESDESNELCMAQGGEPSRPLADILNA